MIDEWFDRSYQQGRVDMNAGVERLIVHIHKAVLTLRARSQSTSKPGANQCDTICSCQSRSHQP